MSGAKLEDQVWNGTTWYCKARLFWVHRSKIEFPSPDLYLIVQQLKDGVQIRFADGVGIVQVT